MLNIEKLVQVRKNKGYTQATLARKVGVDASHLSNIERGKRSASIETLAAILQVLEVDIKEMWSDDGTLPPTMPVSTEKGIVVENGEGECRTRFILPPTPEAYAIVTDQVNRWSSTTDPELRDFFEVWKTLDDDDKALLIRLVREQRTKAQD